MIKEIIGQWEKNKSVLEEYFRTTNQSEYCSYPEIVRQIFKLCITKAYGDEDYEEWDYEWNIDNMTTIDNGDYQGSMIFIIPKDTYQPSVSDYIFTSVGYGSCSCCDTLQGIYDYERGLPTEQQISDYMTLSLHIVQQTKRLGED